jgi:hypothetical protein
MIFSVDRNQDSFYLVDGICEVYSFIWKYDTFSRLLQHIYVVHLIDATFDRYC